MKIEVLGPNCKKCEFVHQRVLEACRRADVAADVEKVSRMERILAYGILATPAVAIDGRVVMSGRVPALKEIREWI